MGGAARAPRAAFSSTAAKMCGLKCDPAMFTSLKPLKQAIKGKLTLGREPQNFLGAPWVPTVVRAAPPAYRRALALRIVSLSPHYFYVPGNPMWPSQAELELESKRNAESRETIAAEVLRPHLDATMSVLDYGCGPGYLAKAVEPYVESIVAVDISEGVLECARALNSGRSITYRSISEPLNGSFDFSYSIAVFQHLTDEAARAAARFIFDALRPGGETLVHVVVDAAGWKPQKDWEEQARRSVLGRLKLELGLNCFNRTDQQIKRIFECAGFANVELRPASEFTSLLDDVSAQHFLRAQKVR
jgi:SAM-dependent methyltransferase